MSRRLSVSILALGSEVQFAYLVEVLYPQVGDISVSPWKLSLATRVQIIKKRNKRSLRELAKEYNVSYETIRQAVKRDNGNDLY